MAQEQKTPLLPRGLIDTLSGSAGGVALVTTGYPFDTMKVRMQTDTTGRFKGMIDCGKQTIKHEGFGGFYKGVASPLVGVTGVNAVAFFSYNQGLILYQNLFNKGKELDRREYSTAPYLFAGTFAGICLSFVEGPVELIKAKLQVQYGSGAGAQYKGTFDCAKQIIGKFGVRGVFQGLGATLARNIPANMAYFTFYEYFKFKLGANENPEAVSPMAILMAGGAAGTAYWVACFPMDVVKSVMQTDELDPAKRKYKNMLHTAQHIYAKSGFKGFFSGFTPCLLRSFPANSACFLAYELSKKALEKL